MSTNMLTAKTRIKNIIAMNESRSKPDKISNRQWTGKTRGGVIGNWIFYTILRCFGLRLAYAVLYVVALYFIFFDAKALKASSDYLGRVGYVGRSRISRFWGCYCHFISFGQISQSNF